MGLVNLFYGRSLGQYKSGSYSDPCRPLSPSHALVHLWALLHGPTYWTNPHHDSDSGATFVQTASLTSASHDIASWIYWNASYYISAVLGVPKRCGRRLTWYIPYTITPICPITSLHIALQRSFAFEKSLNNGLCSALHLLHAFPLSSAHYNTSCSLQRSCIGKFYHFSHTRFQHL
jgi:hypothetical protein